MGVPRRQALDSMTELVLASMRTKDRNGDLKETLFNAELDTGLLTDNKKSQAVVGRASKENRYHSWAEACTERSQLTARPNGTAVDEVDSRRKGEGVPGVS